ncbi:MAG TPA: hypothetical protein VMB73_24905 [Acetobacteraceae bacterium]|jgi:hypothetical protein|nr:hypothetical protein [Acetobacteraceae bacterium]
MDALERRLNELEREAADLLVDAYVHNEEAEGVARAVRLARSGQAWTPYDIHQEAQGLFFGGGKKSA